MLNTFIYNLQTKPYGTVTLAANDIKLYILENKITLFVAYR